MTSRYSIEALRFAFEKSWNQLSYDAMMLSFFEGNRNVFFDYFHMTNHMDSLGILTRRNDLGTHLNTIFYSVYQKMAISLHPNPPGRYLSLEECNEVFSTLENRPTKETDLMKSVKRKEEIYTEEMKTINKRDQMYVYLYFQLHKRTIEQLLDIKKEIKHELLYSQIRESSLTICQSCIVLVLLKAPILTFKESVLACGFSETSVSDFRRFHNKFNLDENMIISHGRDTGRNLAQVIAFLNAHEYDVSQADKFYSKFKTTAAS